MAPSVKLPSMYVYIIHFFFIVKVLCVLYPACAAASP